MKKRKVLLVATVVKIHVNVFHIPCLKMFQEQGWETWVCSRNDYDNPEECVIPYCGHYIDNLCGFIENLIREEQSGLFFPQNKEYVCTADMVRRIAEEHGKKVKLLKVLNPFVRIRFLPYRDKVFGSLIYDCSEDRCSVAGDFAETIRQTER